MDNSLAELLYACNSVDKELMFLAASKYSYNFAMHQSNKCYANLICSVAFELYLCTFTHWHKMRILLVISTQYKLKEHVKMGCNKQLNCF